MSHHKRRRPKSRRAGCLKCKPWKRQGAKRKLLKANRVSVARHLQAAE